MNLRLVHLKDNPYALLTNMAGLRPTCDSLDASEQDLEFQVVDWYIPESDRHLRRDYSAEPMEYEINMFGVTAEGYSVCAVSYTHLTLPTNREV